MELNELNTVNGEADEVGESKMNGAGKHYMLANGETVITFEPSGRSGRSSLCCGRTYLEVALLFVSIISTCIAIALVILLATRHDTIRTITITETDIDLGYSNDRVSANYKLSGDDQNLCLTEECVKAASRLMESMDSSVDPCDDFFEYACGSWNKVNDIPEDRSSYDTFSKLRDIIHMQIKDLLEQPEEPSDNEGALKSKRLYVSCINESLIDDRDLKPAYSLLDELGGWPVVDGDQWRDEDFDLIDLMSKLRLYNNKILIDQWVGTDDKNSEQNVIQLDQADLGMMSRDYYMKGLEESSLQAYEQYAVDVVMMFGANATRAKKEIREMILFEITLANLTAPEEERRDNEALYNKMTIRDLQDMIPNFNWTVYLKEIFSRVDVHINDTEDVVIYASDYLKAVADLILETDNRTLANYLLWRIMMNRVPNLPDKYRELRNEYHKIIYGSKTEDIRWRECVSYVNDNMGNAVGRLFISKHFDETAKKNALEMIEDIRVAVNELLTEVDWMDQKTKLLAMEKADAMAVQIGYPSYILNDSALNEEYKNVHFSPETYFENVLENIRGIAISNLQMLKQSVDKSLWSTTPAIVNAFYSSTKNQIIFPAGILQPPFYSKGFPKSLNYGGIGMVIGHEITHGFDDRGRQYDKNGNLKQWWDDHVIKEFKMQAQCMIDQYSNFTIDKIGLQLNGIQTQGENIADNGGLKEAYRAYQKWKMEHGGSEPRLPGLTHLNNDQLFFLNFAQVWCGTTRPQAMVNRILTGVHSPGRYRVIGTLQNSVDFSQVFSCPKNSYMNPENRCSVW